MTDACTERGSRHRRESGERWLEVCRYLGVRLVGWNGDDSAHVWAPNRGRHVLLRNAPRLLDGLRRKHGGQDEA